MSFPAPCRLVIAVTAVVMTLTSLRALAADPIPAASSSASAAAPLAPVPPAPAPPAPAASPPPRTWLAQPQGNTVAQAPQSSWRPYAILLLTLALGGGALYLRLHRQRQIIANVSPALRVVSTVRVGPKAHLVMAQVGKKTLLLGVTDASVQRVAWLDSESLQELPEQERLLEPSAPIRGASSASPLALEQQPAFNNVLSKLMKVTASRSDEFDNEAASPAEQLAQSTQDTFEGSTPRPRSTKPQMQRRSPSTEQTPYPSDDYEDQVAGLTRRQPRRRG